MPRPIMEPQQNHAIPTFNLQNYHEHQNRCFAYATASYHVYKEIVKLNGVVFKSKPMKIVDNKITPKITSHQ